VDLSPETISNAQQDFGAEPAPTRAITMGIGTMLEARRILLIASGASKGDAVERTLRGPVTESFPASVLRQHPRVVVIVDEAASR
jgi:glucosamine-6-phosphate deaminase